MQYKMRVKSNFPGIILNKGFIPENHGPLAQVIVIPDGLALFGDAFLGTVLELFALLVAGRA